MTRQQLPQLLPPHPVGVGGGGRACRANPDVLDGVGQLLLLRDLQPRSPLVYHSDWSLAEIVKFINRAKDELVTPADFDALRRGGAAGLRGAVRQLRRAWPRSS